MANGIQCVNGYDLFIRSDNIESVNRIDYDPIGTRRVYEHIIRTTSGMVYTIGSLYLNINEITRWKNSI